LPIIKSRPDSVRGAVPFFLIYVSSARVNSFYLLLGDYK
jgi:hypothetical protein